MEWVNSWGMMGWGIVGHDGMRGSSGDDGMSDS